MRPFSLAILATLTACAGGGSGSVVAPTIPITAPTQTPQKFAFLGDSITAGSKLPAGTPTMPTLVSQAIGAPASNLAVPGMTTPGLAAAELPVPAGTTSAVLYIGTNDNWPVVATAAETPVEVESDYAAIVSRLRDEGVVTIYTVLIRDYGHNPSAPYAGATSQWDNAFDGYVEGLRQTVIDLRCFPDVYDPTNYLPDGIHPNADGNMLLAAHITQGIRNGGVTCGL